MSTASALPDSRDPAPGHVAHGSLPALVVGAVGIVFGDIGTSPLYALKESFIGHHPLAVDPLHIFGVLSLIFWTMMIIVSLKYIALIMRADNRGEGGSLALLALLSRKTHGRPKTTALLVVLGVFATAFFYGDSIITPAMSVLSAVEGLTVVHGGMAPFVLPISVAIILGLFFIQAHGTAKVGLFFGPVMMVYFLTIGALGVYNLIEHPGIFRALNPYYAYAFFGIDPKLAFLALGSVVLAVTGAEALYADMGHFGRKPIQVGWVVLVFPALMLNYLGQGGLLLDGGDAAAQNPFFLMAPEMLRLPLVILATLATIIASQAVISGAFSVTQQAVQLGYLPRLRIEHTSASALGQIYIPLVNWFLLVMVIVLVLVFRNSGNLASAYGIAVTATMFCTTCMMGVLVLSVWEWKPIFGIPLVLLFGVVDGAYFASNLTKIPDGGWFPLTVGVVAFTFLTTWAKGRKLMIERLRESSMPVDVFIKSAAGSAARVPGTAVFMTTSPDGVPHALLHNMKHNKVLHSRVVILTVVIDEVPYVDAEDRAEVRDLGSGFWRMIVRYGFMQETNIPQVLKSVERCGPQFKMMDTSFFLARQTLIASDRPGMAIWREKLFAWMLRNAETAMEFFKLPTNRVVELGSQVEI